MSNVIEIQAELTYSYFPKTLVIYEHFVNPDHENRYEKYSAIIMISINKRTQKKISHVLKKAPTCEPQRAGRHEMYWGRAEITFHELAFQILEPKYVDKAK